MSLSEAVSNLPTDIIGTILEYIDLRRDRYIKIKRKRVELAKRTLTEWCEVFKKTPHYVGYDIKVCKKVIKVTENGKTMHYKIDDKEYNCWLPIMKSKTRLAEIVMKLKENEWIEFMES